MDWDDYFISIADVVKEKSKDPSTKIGAVLVGPEHDIISSGFNGFPRGIDESIPARWERPLKYDFIAHAERNAIYGAARRGTMTKGSTLYMVGMGPPCTPCKGCAIAVIQAGVKKVVGYSYKAAPESWKVEFDFTKKLLEEAGVEFVEYLKKAQP